MKTVSLELAKQLKEAGYPQDNEYWWIRLKPDGEWILKLKGTLAWYEAERLGFDVMYATPTADEILDRLPHGIQIYKSRSVSLEGETKYSYQVMFNSEYNDANLADALANLWLYLKKENLL